MAEDGAGQGASVDVGACRCPGTPHARDTVELAPELTVPMGAAAWAELAGVPPSLSAIAARLTASYLRPERDGGAIRSWSFTDESGEPVAVDADAVARLLPFAEGGFEVSERANELYGDAVVAPFLRRQQRPSPPGPTAASTPPTPSSGPSTPTPSARSSRSGRADGSPYAAPAR